ncbi:hypothetical protein HPCPY1313_0305 [Helicobacter pylori CPY1313]|nr:hypothetical protein HPCPY1313_0305 [Helicobacter pylori CPY1313]
MKTGILSFLRNLKEFEKSLLQKKLQCFKTLLSVFLMD